MFSTCFTTYRDFTTDWFRKWDQKLKFDKRMHRKWWEMSIVCESLESNGMLARGKKGVGFGVGSEILPSMFGEMGCEILATDMLPESWGSTHCRFYEANQKYGIQTRVVDMNWIDGAGAYEAVEENGYDFSWSICSMDHCGNAWLTKRFLLNQMNCLRANGLAVHTAEYTINHGLPREGTTAWLTWEDILDVSILMRSLGYVFAPVDWFMGNAVQDHMIDLHPFEGPVHIKAETHGRWGTCVLFAAKKVSDGAFWVPGNEADARREIAEYQLSHSHT
jgi:hypothetical protein